MRKLALISGILLIIAVIATAAFLRQPGPVASIITASKYAAATANPYASRAALEVLRKGGSAVDAAIAAQLVLSLVEPQSSGIGGGLFLLVANGQSDMRVYDGRETAPASASPGLFLGRDDLPRPLEDIARGGRSVGVPGAIAALDAAHRRYGKLPWADLFSPAIRLAEGGYVVSPLVAQAIAELDRVQIDPAMLTAYFNKDGQPIRAGERIRDPVLAKTLQTIAQQGRAGFYTGEVAQEIVRAVQNSSRNPGGMSLKDLEDYQAKEREPVCARFKNDTVCTTPAPSGGVSLLQILRLVNDQAVSSLASGSVSQLHLLSQAYRLAYADRAKWMADPAFANVPTVGLLDSGYLRSRASQISSKWDMGRATAGIPPQKGASVINYAPQRTRVLHGTSHIVVVDAAGQVVSMTASIQAAFGAQIRAAGFMLNNELTDFSHEPRVDGVPVANAPAPGKRPLSAMSPAIVFGPDGAFLLAVGSPGGPEIITYNAQALINVLASGASVSQAMGTPHFANLNGPTVLEKGTRNLALAPFLFLRGHSVRMRELNSGLTAIRKTALGFEAATDIRGEGLAAGD